MADTTERTIGSLTVTIDRLLCVSFEDCVQLAPEVFELDEDGICAFKREIGRTDAERLTDACRACPVDALGVVDADGRTVVP